MGYTYAERKKALGAKTDAPWERAASQRMNALQSGAAKPTSEEMGRQVDLPDAMRAKMESSFGADLSAVKLYESQRVADAGAEAITQGSSIAFAPGKLDLVSSGGQALLGHELSHVVSQQRGEVTGSGFLSDHALEARADREGALAAAGQQVYAGPVTGAMSTASAASAAGPMQAKKNTAEEKADAKAIRSLNTPQFQGASQYHLSGSEGYDALDPEEYEEHSYKANFFKKLFGLDKDVTYKKRKGVTPAINPMVAMKEAGTGNTYENGLDYIAKKNTVKNDLVDNSSGRQELQERLNSKYKGAQYKEGAFVDDLQRGANKGEDKGVKISGLLGGRLMTDLLSDRGRGFHMGDEDVEGLMDKLMAPSRRVEDGVDEEGNVKYRDMNDDEREMANKQFDEGVMQYKDILYGDVKSMEGTYGAMPSQLHPRDFVQQLNKGDKMENYHRRFRSMQDNFQLLDNGGQRYFDMKNNEKDKDFKRLTDYYGNTMINFQNTYMSQYNFDDEAGGMEFDEFGYNPTEETEQSLKGPKMSPEMMKNYVSRVQKRLTDSGHENELMGRFKKKEDEEA
jgi:hypothetical protein